jgi:hypothetical protein
LRRVLDLPRYRAMEAFFDARGCYGRQMMCGTASVHLHVDNSANPALRWQLLRRIAPALVATFTTSAGRDRTGVTWAVVRQRAEIDPGRTGLPTSTAEPVTTWVRYLLDIGLSFGNHTPVVIRPRLGSLGRSRYWSGWDLIEVALRGTSLLVRCRGWRFRVQFRTRSRLRSRAWWRMPGPRFVPRGTVRWSARPWRPPVRPPWFAVYPSGGLVNSAASRSSLRESTAWRLHHPVAD